MSSNIKEVFYTGKVILRKEALEKGLKSYFTGKPCKYGHIAQRITSNGQCVRCSYLRTDRTPKQPTIKLPATRCLNKGKMGLLKIISVNWGRGISDSYGRYLNCICDCGNTRVIDAVALEALKNPSCGCANKSNIDKFKGEVFKGCSGEPFEIIAYFGAKDVSIRFLRSGYEKKHVQLSQIRAGTVKDIMTPSVYGIGINDCITNVDSSPIYKKWHAMLERCYSLKFQEQNTNYTGCYVSEDWKLLSNFKKWWDLQKINNISTLELDKDLLKYGNKEYSSNNCKLIPREINIFLTDNKASRGMYPVGVTKDMRKGVWTGKFRAQCQNPFSEKKKDNYRGTFLTVEEAFEVWRSNKHKYALLLVDAYKDCLDEITKIALSTRYLTGSLLVEEELRRYYDIHDKEA